MSRLSLVVPLVAWGLLSCSSPTPVAAEGTACDLSFQCPAGFICKDHRCTEVVIDAGAPSGGGEGTGGGVGTGGGGVSTGGGTGGGTTDDGGTADAGVDAGVRVTFAPGTYRRCHDDLECAVFGGNCLIDLALSRPDDGGVDRVKVSQIDSTFAADEGICTLPCTADPRICDSIVVDGPSGQSASFHCQMVYAGGSPYPSPAPAFPFDAALDPVALARGVPFASVCRPPFEASVTHEPSFCQACTQDMQCGSGACFIERPAATPASGSCVELCTQQSDCQFGFTCGTLPNSANAQSYCLPAAGTCGRCRDGDGDLRGVGRCGPLDEPMTAVDCDDTNPVAYFDAANPGHAFPGVCGASDVNCNGKSDDVEQLGSEDHCAACGDTCVPRQGELANAVRQCVARTSTSSFACVAACAPGWADCDGDVSTGCETPLSGNVVWAEDADGDGRGNPANFIYACAGSTPPAGWVQNKLDCNDTDSTIYGGDASNPAAPELCDGKDNNCNGLADDPGFIANEGDRCTTTFPGVCSVGTRVCQARGTAQASLNCVPNLDPTARASVAESCNGLDDNCNGQTDEDLDYYEAQGQQNPGGHGAQVTCAVAGGVGICAQGVFACTTRTTALADGGTQISGVWSCNGTPAEPGDAIDDLGLDTNCDGTDGNLSVAVFVRPVSGAGTLDGNDANDGTAQHPVATLARALTLACATTPCRDIYVEATQFTSTAAVALPAYALSADGGIPVRIYGGFDTSVQCPAGGCALSWRRGSNRTDWERDAPAPVSNSNPFGSAYAAFEGQSGSTPLSVLLDGFDITTAAPSGYLTDGQNAPDLIGFRCPSQGCRALELTHSSITVEGGLNGGNGVAGAVGPTDATINGHDGCGKDVKCSSVQSYDEGEWMEYYWPGDYTTFLSQWFNDGMRGIAASGCGDGAANHGGTSAAVRYREAVGQNRYYELVGGYGFTVSGSYIRQTWDFGYPSGTAPGGTCYSDSDTGLHQRNAGSGANGYAGSAGGLSYTAGVTVSGGQPLLRRPSMYSGSSGGSGGGGGGGSGCIVAGNGYYQCPCGGEGRGGGGGAGGCSGFGGKVGGHGGSSIAMLLTSPSSTSNGDTTLVTRDTLTLSAGKGGNGGAGGKGGNGAGGGYGGAGPIADSWLQGGNGGNGGGGGGAPGGAGGSSFAILRWCQRNSTPASSGCGINLPPLMLAAPASFLSAGGVGTPGAGGTGGIGGTKFPRSGTQETPDPAGKGGDAPAGSAGATALLQWYP